MSGQRHYYTCCILFNHHERTQILGSNWIFDNVSEKYREKKGHINRHFYQGKYRYDIGHVKEKVSKIDM